MKWLNLTVSISLAAFAFSVDWLFYTDRLYEPDKPWRHLEMGVAALFGILGLIAAEMNFRD